MQNCSCGANTNSFQMEVFMNKAALIEAITKLSKRFETKAAAADALDAVLQAIMDGLKVKTKKKPKELPLVQLIGFGTFKVKQRPKRKGRNPKTKEEITIPASRTIVFKPGKKLKEMVN